MSLPLIASELLQLVRTDRRLLARLLTRVEAGAAQAELNALHPYTGLAHRVGLTGSPGAGKSTLAAALAAYYRTQGRLVAVIAVDPSSEFTGGALLGDRIRMNALAGDPGVFIRSLAARGSGDGVSRAVADCLDILDAAGFAMILVETVGAGQDQTAITRLVHTTVVVEAPGMGDDIQAIKAGLLESADILAVNKSDLPGAEASYRALHHVIEFGKYAGWTPPLVRVVAATGAHIPALADQIDAHRLYLRESGVEIQHAQSAARSAIREHLTTLLLDRLLSVIPSETLDSAVADVAQRQHSAREAARTLFNSFSVSLHSTAPFEPESDLPSASAGEPEHE